MNTNKISSLTKNLITILFLGVIAGAILGLVSYKYNPTTIDHVPLTIDTTIWLSIFIVILLLIPYVISFILLVKDQEAKKYKVSMWTLIYILFAYYPGLWIGGYSHGILIIFLIIASVVINFLILKSEKNNN